MAGCRPKGRTAQLEKSAEPARSLGVAQCDHAVVTVRGARTVVWRLAVAQTTRRGMEAGASMRGERKSRRVTPRRWELTE
jgi:hypothetical protein